MRVATGGLAASESTMPASISTAIAASISRSTVHHQLAKRVRSAREIMTVPVGRAAERARHGSGHGARAFARPTVSGHGLRMIKTMRGAADPIRRRRGLGERRSCSPRRTRSRPRASRRSAGGPVRSRHHGCMIRPVAAASAMADGRARDRSMPCPATAMTRYGSADADIRRSIRADNAAPAPRAAETATDRGDTAAIASMDPASRPMRTARLDGGVLRNIQAVGLSLARALEQHVVDQHRPKTDRLARAAACRWRAAQTRRSAPRPPRWRVRRCNAAPASRRPDESIAMRSVARVGAMLELAHGDRRMLRGPGSPAALTGATVLHRSGNG